ncbi:MAG: hypothetical protein QOD61_497 [Solirubrobacteraceae bacterium]|jgi:hypothetical protein|nr:hypothetical protein [Solirubrobacteraceae bacterium]MEA2354368.1 hypothetical protein [Solirubrobacteraceae bacterium]
MTWVEHRAYTAEEVDAAVHRLQDPERFDHASEVVTHAAPGLAGVLDAALADGGWFGPAHEHQVRQAAEAEDPAARYAAVDQLVAEQTRIGMLVGVAVGFELARELEGIGADPTTPPAAPDPAPEGPG